MKFPWKKIRLLSKKEKKMVWNRTKTEVVKLDLNLTEMFLLGLSKVKYKLAAGTWLKSVIEVPTAHVDKR